MKAFPSTVQFGHGEDASIMYEPGMSLHDYFTAKIMQGFCSNPAIFAPNDMCGWSLVNADDFQLIGYARKLADNMIEAREGL